MFYMWKSFNRNTYFYRSNRLLLAKIGVVFKVMYIQMYRVLMSKKFLPNRIEDPKVNLLHIFYLNRYIMFFKLTVLES